MADAKIIRPAQHISQKVRKTGGPSPADAIMRALNAAEDLMGQYQGWAFDDLGALWQKFNDTVVKGDVGTGDIKDMLESSKEIRGQGGQFGLPQITMFWATQYMCISGRWRLTAVRLEVIGDYLRHIK